MTLRNWCTTFSHSTWLRGLNTAVSLLGLLIGPFLRSLSLLLLLLLLCWCRLCSDKLPTHKKEADKNLKIWTFFTSCVQPFSVQPSRHTLLTFRRKSWCRLLLGGQRRDHGVVTKGSRPRGRSAIRPLRATLINRAGQTSCWKGTFFKSDAFEERLWKG